MCTLNTSYWLVGADIGPSVRDIDNISSIPTKLPPISPTYDLYHAHNESLTPQSKDIYLTEIIS